jgi:OOP family OmpA-OmpF porin
MKKIILTLLLSFISTQAFAQDSKFYFGASGGQTKFDTGVTAITARLDEKDTGFKVFAGYEINENVSIEGFYADLGNASLSGTNGQTFRINNTTYQFTSSASVSVKGTALGASILAGVPINEYVKPYAKIGFSRTKSEVSYSGTNAPNESETNTEPMYGVGVDFNITKSIALRIEYEFYKSDGEKAKLISAGVKFRF